MEIAKSQTLPRDLSVQITYLAVKLKFVQPCENIEL